MTAIGWSLALVGVVSSPSSGAMAMTGVGSGVGDGVTTGLGEPPSNDGLAPDALGAPLEPFATWLADVPLEAAGLKKPPAEAANTTPATTTATRPSAMARARMDEVMDDCSSLARGAIPAYRRVPRLRGALHANRRQDSGGRLDMGPLADAHRREAR